MKEIKKHAFLWWLFVKNALLTQLEYRANFFTGIAMEAGYLIVKLLYVIVIYNAGVEVNGLSPDEILVFVGTFVIFTAFYAGLFMMNHFELSERIRNGTLDFYIVKPVSLQFIATLSRSDLMLFFTDFIPGVIMVAVGLSRLHVSVDILSFLGFVGYMLSGVIVSYSLFLFPVIFSFWFVKADAVASVTSSFWDFNNMPMTIYSKTVQRIGIYVFPVFVIVNFPTLFVMGQLAPAYAAWGVAAPVIWFAVTRLFWKKAVRRYSSASS
jgi:ABC-type uncharacterized transport system, permease component